MDSSTAPAIAKAAEELIGQGLGDHLAQLLQLAALTGDASPPLLALLLRLYNAAYACAHLPVFACTPDQVCCLCKSVALCDGGGSGSDNGAAILLFMNACRMHQLEDLLPVPLQVAGALLGAAARPATFWQSQYHSLLPGAVDCAGSRDISKL